MRNVLPIVASVLLLTAPSFADDAALVFESLYGSKVKQVNATTDRADDVALAKDLLAAAKASADQQALLAVLCDNAYDLGMRHPDGFMTAADAMRLTIEHVESNRPSARSRLSDVLIKQMRAGSVEVRAASAEALISLQLEAGAEYEKAGDLAQAAGSYRQAVAVAMQNRSAQLDAARARVESLKRTEQTQRKLSQLKERLLEKADAAIAGEIVKLYVIELDSPGEALAYLDRTDDARLKRLVPLAAKPVTQLSTDEHMLVGEWYAELAALASDSAKIAMLQRAHSKLSHFLDAYTTDDLHRKKAILLRTDVRGQLAKLNVVPESIPSIPKPGKSIDLLALIDVPKHTVRGSWKQSSEGLSTTSSPASISVPLTVKGDYELKMKITRLNGKAGIGLMLPIGDTRRTEFQMDGWPASGGRTGFAMDGKDAGSSKSTLYQRMYLTNGRSAVLTIAVMVNDTEASIRLDLDDKTIIDWKGPLETFYKAKSDEENCIRLFTGSSVVYLLESVELKAAAGQVKRIDPSK